MSALFFSSFDVSRQAFYRSGLAAAIVNLKPIVPGHVLVIPTRVVPRLSDLRHDELTSLMASVQRVGRVIERVYAADGLTIACQDGKAAGQTVPHVHFHLLPRKLQGDRFTRNDEVYPELERSEGGLPEDLRQVPQPLQVDADEERKARTSEDMEKEAKWLRTFFEPTKGESGEDEAEIKDDQAVVL
ncbi:diadenosine hydrolase [Fomes fomentarius]|nr:diadenosine hydrolase [Fomes fomentarius]